MSITRDPEYPAEYAQLAAVINRCAEGYTTQAVLHASLQILSAAIGQLAKEQGSDLEATERYTAHVGACLMSSIQLNWERKSKPTDVEVKSS